MRVTVISIVDGALGTVPKDHTNYSIVEIGRNTEKSPGDMRRLAVTETLVKEPQLMVAWKTRKKWNNNIIKRPNLMLSNKNKRISHKEDFHAPANNQEKIKRKWNDKQILGPS